MQKAGQLCGIVVVCKRCDSLLGLVQREEHGRWTLKRAERKYFVSYSGPQAAARGEKEHAGMRSVVFSQPLETPQPLHCPRCRRDTQKVSAKSLRRQVTITNWLVDRFAGLTVKV